MAEKVASKVQFEINQIDRLFSVYADLLERAAQTPPDSIEIAAIASVLHSFYNGVENIFLIIAKGIDQEVPSGGQWHRDLLIQMTQETPKRKHVISTELAQRLADYLGFRHFYRHSYTFFLEWSEMEKLVLPVREVWEQVKQELLQFLDTLGSVT